MAKGYRQVGEFYSTTIFRKLIAKGMLFFFLVILVSGCAPQGFPKSGQAVTPYQFIFSTVWFFLLGVFVYFMLVRRPELDREKAQEKFVSELKKNDEVLTRGGIFGRVVSVKQDVITVEIAQGVKVRVKAQDVLKPGESLDSKTASQTSSDL